MIGAKILAVALVLATSAVAAPVAQVNGKITVKGGVSVNQPGGTGTSTSTDTYSTGVTNTDAANPYQGGSDAKSYGTVGGGQVDGNSVTSGSSQGGSVNANSTAIGDSFAYAGNSGTGGGGSNSVQLTGGAQAFGKGATVSENTSPQASNTVQTAAVPSNVQADISSTNALASQETGSAAGTSSSGDGGSTYYPPHSVIANGD